MLGLALSERSRKWNMLGKALSELLKGGVMQSAVSTSVSITQHYATAIDSLCEIANTYCNLGKVVNAQHVLRTSLELLSAGEVQPQQRLRLLLQYARILIVGQLFARTDQEYVLSIIEQARQSADALQDQQGIADALSMLGQAHYFVTTLGSSTLDNPQGNYDQALAFQEQALAIRETLQDTRGISESHFCLGNVYERWQQPDRALEHYAKARQIADQNDHRYERTEPTRHLALLALQQGNLDGALDYALQALCFREEVQFKPYLPLDHVLLSSIYLAKGDTTHARFHTEKAL